MTIHISGGSNSIYKKGWTTAFLERYSGSQLVKNLSVGGASSMMSAYRLISTCEVRSGDTVIWEYALNDANHIDQKGIDERDLIGFVEYIIRHCGERGAVLIPVIERPLSRELRDDEEDTYRASLRSLFNYYDVRFLDVSSEFARRNGLQRIQPSYYESPNHYEGGGPVVDFMARRVARLIRSRLKPPRQAAPKYAKKTLAFYDDFTGGKREIFRNRLLRTSVYSPTNKLVLEPFRRDGNVAGIIMIAYPDGGAWLVQIGESQAILSASFREKGWDKPLLKFLALGFACGRPFPYTAGDRLRLETTTETAGICADYGFQRQPAPEALAAQRSLAVGVLVEEE